MAQNQPSVHGSTWYNPYKCGKREIGIFELSELFGISSETLRKYEKKQILLPTRNKSGYRCYGTWDLTKIIRMRQMRQEGFSLNAIAEMINCESPEDGAGIEELQKKLLEQIIFNKKLIRWLGYQKDQFAAFEAQKDRISVEQTPEWHCCIYMVDDTLVIKEETQREELKAWLEALPFAHVMYIGNIQQGVVSCLVLSTREKEELGLQSLKPDFIIPEQMCVTMTATAEHTAEYDSSDQVIKTVMARAQAQNAPTADYHIIEMIRFTQVNGIFRSYNKAFVPLKID